MTDRRSTLSLKNVSDPHRGSRFHEGARLFLIAVLFFALFSPGFEAGETARTIKGAAYFLRYGEFATEETDRRAEAGEPAFGPGKTKSFRYGGPVLFFQFVGVLGALKWLMHAFPLFPDGSSEFWYAVGFGLSFLPTVWSALTLVGFWLVLGMLGIPPRHGLIACALLAVTSHQLPLTKTAYDGLFLGTVAIFAVWCVLRGRAHSDDGSTGFVALAALLLALGVSTKETGILLAFPLGLLVLTSKATVRSKTCRILLLAQLPR